MSTAYRTPELEGNRVAYELLTTPLETPSLQILTERQQLDNAYFVSGALQGVLRGLERTTSEEAQEQIRSEPSTAWLGDISRALIRGERVTIEPGTASSSSYAPEDLGVAHMAAQHHSLALTGLFRAIIPSDRQIGLVTLAHNAYSFVGGESRISDPMYRRQHILSTAELLRKQGALRKGDKPGRDYTILATDNFIHTGEQPDGIISQLRQSEWGEVVPGIEDTGLRFVPNNSLREILSLNPRQAFGRFEEENVTVQWSDGLETKSALHAQALQPILQSSGNHITIANTMQYDYYQKVFALLRATNSTKQHLFHTIREHDYHTLPGRETDPTEFAYWVGKQLQGHVQHFIKSCEMFESFDNFDPYEYTMRNYGKAEALKDDQDICKVVSFALANLDIHDADVVDVGSGPNPYPAGLMLPFAKSVTLLEYAEPNRDYMRAFLNRTLPHDYAKIWPKFEHHMKEGGGDPYEGVLTRLQQAAQEGHVTVEPGNIFRLPKKKWRIASQYFVDDSISIYRSDYREAVASMCDAIEDEGLVISGNMLNDKNHVGYNAGRGRLFPNISQNATELKQAYTDNDMYSLVIPVGDTRKAREGYYGMVITLAAKRNSTMRHKLEGVKTQLQAMDYTVL